MYMRWRWLLTILFILASCSEQYYGNFGVGTDDASLETAAPLNLDSVDSTEPEEVSESEDIYSIWTDPCIDCKWYFCPPLSSVWQKEICINECNNPPTVVYEGECKEYLECDPSNPIIETDIPCYDEDGYPGTQDKICNKGQIQFTSCVTQCDDETCDGEDEDCDGVIDEGFSEIEEVCNNIDDNCNGVVDEGEWECDEGCGPGPNLCIAGVFMCTAPMPEEEICDGIDNDCDDEVDEGQLNACEQCGPVPEEVCDGVDNNCDGDTDEGLIQPCGTACGEGYEICAQGNWISCTAPPVEDEICDGLDNDCDGQIDEELECVCTIQDVGSLFPCQEPPLLCGKGYKTCECLDFECKTIVTTECYAICHWLTQPPGSDPTCDPTIGMPIAQEECNNFDDDCDQDIDEDLFAGCYTGPEGTIGVGICIPGEMTCDAGVWGHYNEQDNFMSGYCKDEITPQEEICNGVDDDCNGETDWGEQLQDTDILFILDWSGSMGQEIGAVMIALNKFAAAYADEQVLQWGTVIGPRTMPGFIGKDYLELYHNLSGFSDFLSTIGSLNPSSMKGSKEMLLDAIYLAVQNISSSLSKPIADLGWFGLVEESIPHHDNFIINWRSNASRIIILFTDEPPQSYLIEDNSGLIKKLDIGDISVAIQNTPQLKLYVFSTNENWEWDELASDGNGKYFNLTSNPTEMYISLMEILDEICKSGGNDVNE